MSQDLAPVPSSVIGRYVEDQMHDPNSSNNYPVTQLTESSSPLKRKRNLPGTPDPDSEVVALSPNSLMATNKFLCEVCNKGFQRDQNLQLHRRGHNLPWKLKQRSNKEVVKKKVYICPENSCVHHDPSRALGDLTGIKKHFSRKHGEKKWKCDKCPKKYAVKSDWKAHCKICGTREHKCDCGTLFSRKDSFITHRAFCTAVVDQSGSSSAAAGTNNNNPFSLMRNDVVSGTFGNPQSMETTYQMPVGRGGGFYPELLSTSSSFDPAYVDNSKSSVLIRRSQWLENHIPVLNNVSAAHNFLMENNNPTAYNNLSHELLLLQHAGQTTNLFGTLPWLDKCSLDQTTAAFGNSNNMLASLDQIMIGNNNTSSAVMQVVKREDETHVNNNEEYMTSSSLYSHHPSNLNNQQQQAMASSNQLSADQQFLSSSFLGRNNSSSHGNIMSYGVSNGQVVLFPSNNNNGFTTENSFCNDSSSSFINSRPLLPVSKDAENMNHHVMLMHEAAAVVISNKQEAKDVNTKQQIMHDEKSSETRDFLGVGGVEGEELQQLASSIRSRRSVEAADI
ncbi:unnamed protein product [Rhodiola kirilowii]